MIITMSIPFHQTIPASPELGLLKKAQDAILTSFCGGSNCPETLVTGGNLYKVAAFVTDPLMQFKTQWTSKQTQFERNLEQSQTIVYYFGSPDGWGVFGYLVAISLLITFLVICYTRIKEVTKNNLGGRVLMEMVVNTVFLGFILACITLAALTVFWLIGYAAAGQVDKLQATVEHDAGNKNESDLFRAFNHPDFSKIWKGIDTPSLQQIYNCEYGQSNANFGLSQLGGSFSNQLNCSLCNLVSIPVPSVIDSTSLSLLNGLNALSTANIMDFDRPGVSYNINVDVNYLLNALAPSPSLNASIPLTPAQAQRIVYEEVVPLMQQSKYQASGSNLTNLHEKQKVFVDDMPSCLIPGMVVVVQKYWPHLNPVLYMDDVDNSMSTFFYNGVDYYNGYLREYVIAVMNESVNQVTWSMSSSIDARFASFDSFFINKWPNIVSNISAMKNVVADLYTNVCRYDTFISSQRTSNTSIGKMLYQNIFWLAIIFAATFGVWYVFKSRMGRELFDILGKGKNGSGDDGGKRADLTWKVLDFIKYGLVVAAAVLFVITIMKVMKDKMDANASHNANAVYYNTQKLKSAAWTLMNTIYPVNCSQKTNDKVAMLACKKGGSSVGYDPQSQTLQTLHLEVSKTNKEKCLAFYNAATTLVNAYEQCNLVTQNNNVPFPYVEIFLLSVILFSCIGGAFFLTTMAAPSKQLAMIKTCRRLTMQIHDMYPYSHLPRELASVIDNQVGCNPDSVRIMKILSFIFVFILFVVVVVLMIFVRQSSSDYSAAINTVSPNKCL